MTVVHLLRHGEVHNPDKVLYGRLPGFALSAQGRRMADAAARHLARRPLVAVYSSPLERARQTAEPLAGLTGLPVAVDPRLIESSNVFEGSRVEVGPAIARHPRLWRHLWNPFRPSWGEPYEQVADRMLAAVLGYALEHDGGEIACVSHQLPIWVSRLRAEARPLWHRPDRRQCALASVTSLVVQDGRVVRVEYAEPVGASGGTGTVGA